MTKMNVWVTALFLVGCGGTPGARPHDMSTAGHEETARQEEQQASEHVTEPDPVTAHAPRCTSPQIELETGGACWTTDVAPSEQQRAEAERHLRAAADHRVAARALREAESTACAGIDELDRAMSPFAHRDDIASVAPLTERNPPGRHTIAGAVGATVVLRARPGMTTEWLQRLVDCHLARNASMGHDVPEMPYCPLVPHGVTAQVRSTGDGFAIELSADDTDGAAEVLRRAESLIAN